MAKNIGAISDLLGIINDWIENYTKIRNTNLLVSTIYEKCGKNEYFQDEFIIIFDKNDTTQ